MARHNKTGEALAKYRRKQAAKKVRNGQKERRLKARADARAEAIANYEKANRALAEANAAASAALAAAEALVDGPDAEALIKADEAHAKAAAHRFACANIADACEPAYQRAVRSRELEQARLGTGTEKAA